MSGKKITIRAADEAHYLNVSKTGSRIIILPVRKRMVKTRFTISSFEGVKHFYPDLGEDFEKELRRAFAIFIELNMSYIMKENKTGVSAAIIKNGSGVANKQ